MLGNNEDNDNDREEPDVSSFSSSSHTSFQRYRILGLIETFIKQISSIRKTLLGVSISALIVAHIAIGLSAYLLLHSSFIAVLETENEFGIILTVLLAAIIIICSIWLVAAIAQYRVMGSWGKKYGNYIREKQQRDRMIASQYSEDTTTKDY